MIEERVDRTDGNRGEEELEPGVEWRKPRSLKKKGFQGVFFQKGGGRQDGSLERTGTEPEESYPLSNINHFQF